MGDMADALMEEGESGWWQHIAGNCGDDYCQYCEQEEAQREKWRRQKRQQRRKRARKGPVGT